MKHAKDGKLWIPDNEFWTGWGLNYEKSHWNEVKQYIQSTRVALDVGAHVGIWSIRMGGIFDTVHSFEALSKHVQCFNENLKLFDNVNINQIGLSNTVSTLKMKALDFNSGASSFEYKIVQKNTKHKQTIVDVDTRPLDSYNLKNVDFIKMDVEGHELKVIAGAKRTLTENSPVIFIEILNRNKPYDDITSVYTGLNALAEFGYRMEKHVGSGNYICVKR